MGRVCGEGGRGWRRRPGTHSAEEAGVRKGSVRKNEGDHAGRLRRPALFAFHAGDAAELVGSLDDLLLEHGRVSLLRDAFHVVLAVVASIVRRLRWKTKFGGQLRSGCRSPPSTMSMSSGPGLLKWSSSRWLR